MPLNIRNKIVPVAQLLDLHVGPVRLDFCGTPDVAIENNLINGRFPDEFLLIQRHVPGTVIVIFVGLVLGVDGVRRQPTAFFRRNDGDSGGAQAYAIERPFEQGEVVPVGLGVDAQVDVPAGDVHVGELDAESYELETRHSDAHRGWIFT